MTVKDQATHLYEFMPYGAPELREVARKYMVRGVAVASAGWIIVYMLSFGTNFLLAHRPHETSVVVVPYRELAAPPPLTQNAPPPQVSVATPVAPPTAAVPVPVPEAEAPPEQTIASQQEIANTTPSTGTEGSDIQVAPPEDDGLPKFGDYVFVEELPEVITRVQPTYPDLAREAGVDGTVMVQALVGKDGKVKDTRITKHIAMLDASAEAAVKQWVFKPALSNNKPVAVWVAVPVKFSLH